MRASRIAPVLAFLTIGCGGGAPGSECAAAGEGQLRLEIGQAGQEDASVLLQGPDGDEIVESGTHELDLAGGTYTISGERRATYPEGERVGFVYEPSPPEAEVCVGDGTTTEHSVSFDLLVGSHQLWFTSTNGEQLVGSAAGEDLLASGDVEPVAQFQGAASLITQNSIAFDAAGNMWSSANDGQILFRAEPSLGATGDGEPSRILDLSAICEGIIPCTAAGLAFDAAGNLWLGIANRIVMIARGDLGGVGATEPTVTIASDEIDAVEALAFDSEGNLWAASFGSNQVLMYRSAHLDGDFTGSPDVVLDALSPEPVIAPLGGPAGLAFDADGALWVGYWGSNVVAKFEPSELQSSGELTPSVQLNVGVLALPESIAFDEAGNLWLPSETGSVVAIAHEQLVPGGDPALGATRLSSEALGSVVDLAFNPRPSWSPILGPQ